MRQYQAGRAYAEQRDREDRLARVRERFYTKEGQIYMDGNSLGLCSQDAEAAVLRAVSDWKQYGIGIWTGAPTNYFLYHDVIGEKIARLIHARPEEVTVCGNTTLNVHQCIATFWKPTATKYRILIDNLNFPTDRYAVTSQVRTRGMDPEDVIKVVESGDGKTLSEEEIIAAMTEDVALVLLPSVLYRSAQLLDLARLTKAAHARGIVIGFDLCHSIGNVDHDLEKIDCDFALWCNYKYLSGGPGAVAGLYINRRHFGREPGLSGWWGNRKDTQFELRNRFEHAENAGGWQTGTGSVLSMAAIDGALEVYRDLDMADVREKSLDLTAYLMYLIETELSGYGFTIGNPREDAVRGGHVALEHPEAARINEALKAADVVPDFRYPNVIRLAPVPLYVRYQDVYDLVARLKTIMETKAYEQYENKAGTVA
ncbi:MAG: kynureninase [Ruminococcaceae bacterium]|nr:kynureninase [Oscillospiraceae bacterium]